MHVGAVFKLHISFIIDFFVEKKIPTYIVHTVIRQHVYVFN